MCPDPSASVVNAPLLKIGGFVRCTFVLPNTYADEAAIARYVL
jgi:hypothetical protein